MSKEKGFTLIELLVVIAIIAILAVIVIIAINPAKQLAESRNAQRWSNINTILNAVSQEAIDNNGTVNVAITATCPTMQNICNGACTGGANIASVVPTFIASIPTDPTAASGTDTGYDVCKGTANRITVSAPGAELSETISVSR